MTAAMSEAGFFRVPAPLLARRLLSTRTNHEPPANEPWDEDDVRARIQTRVTEADDL